MMLDELLCLRRDSLKLIDEFLKHPTITLGGILELSSLGIGLIHNFRFKQSGPRVIDLDQ